MTIGRVLARLLTSEHFVFVKQCKSVPCNSEPIKCRQRTEQGEGALHCTVLHYCCMMGQSVSESRLSLTFTLSRLSAKFFLTSYLTFLVHTLLCLLAKNLSILARRASGE
jgi:hypothetical protein